MLEKYKRNRLININGNVIIASLIGTALAIYPVHLTKMITNSDWLIVLLSFFIDGTLDVIIFISLHIFIHKSHVAGFKPSKIILKDILKIQSQRIVLSIFYLIFAVGGHYLLLQFDFERTIAFLIAYLGALIISRILHTIYGLRTGLFEKI